MKITYVTPEQAAVATKIRRIISGTFRLIELALLIWILVKVS